MTAPTAPETMSDAAHEASTRPDRPTVVLDGVSQEAGGDTVLQPVSSEIRAGEMVAIAGASGAGKSTLVRLLAGLTEPATGRIRTERPSTDGGCEPVSCGFVPQDDIVHGELPLDRTLGYDAELRLPDADAAARSASVDRTLRRLGLCDRREVLVSSLSGGQRKRASIAAELLAEPELLVLDEPTSGLDPVSCAEVMAQLRQLADAGTAVVLTTHHPAELACCDRVMFLADGGHLAFDGTPDEARHTFGVDDLADVYARLGRPAVADAAGSAAQATTVARTRPPRHVAAPQPSSWCRQWSAVARRSIHVMLRSPLTLAILLGSPAMVIGMMAAVFRPGVFDADAPSVVPAAQVVFWVVFGAFFFGLTYGLLQIVTERTVIERERFAGLRPSAYVAAKVTVLLPFLAAVDAVMLLVLRRAGQLPVGTPAEWVERWLVLCTGSAAALGVGLLASAAVRTPAQATLALPMLCFPQVLFAGAIVPVSEMALPGRLLSITLVGRWSFESLGRSLGLDDRIVGGSTPDLGYLATFAGGWSTGIWPLLLIAASTLAATVLVVGRHR